MSRAARLIGLLAILALSGCPSVQKRLALKDCQFNVRGVTVDRITPFEAQLTVTIGVYNPNSIEVIVDKFDYTVLISGRKLADGVSQHGVAIPVNSSRDLKVSVRANVVDAAMAIQRLRGGAKRKITLAGTSYVRVPWGVFPYRFTVSKQF